MSFLRHREIFPSDGGAGLAANTPAHRLDEFPAGYSLAGCAPAEPAAASPDDHHFAGSSFRRTMSFHPTASCGLTGCLSRRVHCKVPTIGLALIDHKRVAVRIPADSILTVSSSSRAQDMRMVDVLWEGQTVVMFAEDVQKRGEEITTKAASR
jgi:hypothetical protein